MAKRQSIHIEGMSHSVPIPNAARVGNLLMTGTISGRNLTTGEVPEDPGEAIRELFANAERILDAAGGSFGDVVKMTFYVKDRAIRGALDAVWISVFPDERDRPARHVIGDPDGPNLQAELTAFID
ncbi:MAG TPA: RidA family protein [Acidimicrobiales bacterium]|nr:RidA family protein [Acidimicrobiales bacterium]